MFMKKKLIWLLALAAAGGLYAGRVADRVALVHARAVSSQPDPSIFVTYGMSASADANAGLDSDLGPLDLTSKVLGIIKYHFVEPIDPYENSKMAHSAVKYMVASLGDVNSRFLDKDQSATLRDMAQGKFHGIGVVLKVRERKLQNWTDQQLTVVSAVPGSPAEKAGLLPGDVIDRLDDKWVMSHDPYVQARLVSKDFKADRSAKLKAFKDAQALAEKAIGLDEASDKLTSAKSGEFSLKVLRGSKPLSLKVSVADVTSPLVTAQSLPGGVGYVRIHLLTSATSAEFFRHLDTLSKGGMSALVLDLRDCPGGSITAAQSLAGRLIPGRKMAVIIRSRGRKDSVAAAAGQPVKARLVVLVNEGTEGASEVLAGALRDCAKARLIGQTTWGDAWQRTAYTFPDGSGYTLTTGKYLTPAGVNFNRLGLKPDAVVPMSPAHIGGEGDTQLQRALVVARRSAS